MAATPIKVFVKDPLEILDYTIRWRRWLKGDTISSSAWAIAVGMTVGVTSFGGDLALAWLSGGVDGSTYLATNTIVTLGGRTGVRTIQLSVRAR